MSYIKLGILSPSSAGGRLAPALIPTPALISAPVDGGLVYCGAGLASTSVSSSKSATLPTEVGGFIGTDVRGKGAVISEDDTVIVTRVRATSRGHDNVTVQG